MKVSAVVGRFQVDKLHEGHESLLKKVHDEEGGVLCVVLGGNENKGSRRNPLDFVTRKVMVETWYRETYGEEEYQTNPPVVMYLQDQPSDEVWSKHLDVLIGQAFPGAKITLYGGRDSFIKCYSGNIKTVDFSQMLDVAQDVTGTKCRSKISERPRITEDFRRGVIFSTYNQWPRVNPCVDIAVTIGDEILLGRKKNEAKWRFFGGFVDQCDLCLETCCCP